MFSATASHSAGLQVGCELVIFDCDGVLIDSEVISARTLIRQLGLVGVNVDFAHVQRHFLGRSWSKVAAEIRQTHGLDLTTDFEGNYRSELLKAYETDLKTMPGVERVLGGLAVPFCAATSSSPARVRRSLEISALASFFGDRVFTASQVEHGKPAPDLFLLAARSMGVTPDRCLVIEDSLAGIAAARAAGMEVWCFAGGSHFQPTLFHGDPAFDGITTFDKWDQFFQMAPGLGRGERESSGS